MQQRRRAGSQRRARPGFTPGSLFTTWVEPELALELPVYSSPVNGIVRDVELIFIVDYIQYFRDRHSVVRYQVET